MRASLAFVSVKKAARVQQAEDFLKVLILNRSVTRLLREIIGRIG